MKLSVVAVSIRFFLHLVYQVSQLFTLFLFLRSHMIFLSTVCVKKFAIWSNNIIGFLNKSLYLFNIGTFPISKKNHFDMSCVICRGDTLK